VAKKIDGELHFSADPATVFEMVTDQAYVQEKNERTGGIGVETEVTNNDDGSVEIYVTRALPAQIPSFAKKFVGEQITTQQTDVWQPAQADGNYRGTLHVDFGKAPMAITGTFQINATDNGSVLVVTAEAKATVPFVGGKLEGVAADQFNRAVRKEQEVGQDWLSR
jgi:acylphosphatase